MTWQNLEIAWKDLVDRQQSCTECAKCSPSRIHARSKPLFGRFNVWPRGALFVFEAPNLDDTIDPDKGYLTYDRETDPSGRFARQLMVEELDLDPRFFQVTNSVLCLPAEKGTKYPVSSDQRRLCSSLLREQILVLDPAVVVSVGGKALEATRKIEDHGFKKMVDAVAQQVPWFKRLLFPLFHTSMQARFGPGGRTPEKQRRDWRKLREILLAKGVVFPHGATEHATSPNPLSPVGGQKETS